MTRHFKSYAWDLGVFVTASFATYFAQMIDRPITAVLIYLSGVMLIAVHSGLTNALIAAVAASLVYNFFLSQPEFEFGVTSLDEAVPLLAFNATALLTGVLVGKLKDTAIRERRANADASFLLTVSDRLQSALTVSDVEGMVRGLLPTQGVRSVKIFLARGDYYLRPSTGEIKSDRLDPLLEDVGTERNDRSVVLELSGARGALGIAKFAFTDDLDARPKLPDLQSITALLALAIERCLLLEQLAEKQILSRSEALKDSLLSSISHDLRTPITVIEAAAGALISEEISLADNERRNLLRTMIEQCRRLDRYTSELLDVGRIQAGIDRSTMQPVDLNDVVNLAIRQLQQFEPELTIERKVDRSPANVLGSAALLEQALFNVLHNAAKYCSGKPVELAMTKGPSSVSLAVSDRGPGIGTSEQSQVFERFYKSERSKQEGTGLGLFIAKGFTEACGGSILLESPIDGGIGTRVTLEFPLVEPTTSEVSMASA